MPLNERTLKKSPFYFCCEQSLFGLSWTLFVGGAHTILPYTAAGQANLLTFNRGGVYAYMSYLVYIIRV